MSTRNTNKIPEWALGSGYFKRTIALKEEHARRLMTRIGKLEKYLADTQSQYIKHREALQDIVLLFEVDPATDTITVDHEQLLGAVNRAADVILGMDD